MDMESTNKEWKKAMAKLAKIAATVDLPCTLTCEQWKHGAGRKMENRVYQAYVEGYGHSGLRSNPMDAVEELEARIK